VSENKPKPSNQTAEHLEYEDIAPHLQHPAVGYFRYPDVSHLIGFGRNRGRLGISRGCAPAIRCTIRNSSPS
jgi:hypothetical protein